jgi:hypothetical protein
MLQALPRPHTLNQQGLMQKDTRRLPLLQVWEAGAGAAGRGLATAGVVGGRGLATAGVVGGRGLATAGAGERVSRELLGGARKPLFASHVEDRVERSTQDTVHLPQLRATHTVVPWHLMFLQAVVWLGQAMFLGELAGHTVGSSFLVTACCMPWLSRLLKKAPGAGAAAPFLGTHL